MIRHLPFVCVLAVASVIRAGPAAAKSRRPLNARNRPPSETVRSLSQPPAPVAPDARRWSRCTASVLKGRQAPAGQARRLHHGPDARAV